MKNKAKKTALEGIQSKKMLGLMIMLIGFLAVPCVIAEVQFFDVSGTYGSNDTIYKQIVISYYKDNFASGSALLGTQDFVKSGTPYQAQFGYDINVKSWNTASPTHNVDYCNITFSKTSQTSNTSQILFSRTYTNDNLDASNEKYFVLLNDKETASAKINCKFSNSSGTAGLLMPSNIYLNSPTLECKACQYYEWSIAEINNAKTETIAGNTASTIGFIQRLFSINFEIWLILFWTFLIAMIFIGINFIFMGMYWVFLYIKSYARR